MGISRDQAKIPVLPTEEVEVTQLGGFVTVRGLLLSERMEHDQLNTDAAVPLAGETEDQARARAGAIVVPSLLHRSVVDPEGKPLLSVHEWNVFGATNRRDIFLLFNTAMRLSGQDLQVIEKN